MNMPKIFVGPMSKNIVDSCIDFNKGLNKLALIPSRRQVEKNGGYVNGWNTKTFASYCSDILIKRDHAGPGQGQKEDDGFESLKEDCGYMDYIHLDPWKKYPEYQDGLHATVEMINFCSDLNSEIRYEIGTEESIRRFTADELSTFVIDLEKKLSSEVFSKIDYLVIQSGTSLKGNQNTGKYCKNRLIKMVNVCKKHNLLSKEHNGDYIGADLIKEKLSFGLDSINIAPEFGLIETECYLKSGINFEKFWQICFESKKWMKWVDQSFKPKEQKEQLIKICGHYVFSDEEFMSIKPNIDQQIKLEVTKKLNELYT